MVIGNRFQLTLTVAGHHPISGNTEKKKKSTTSEGRKQIQRKKIHKKKKENLYMQR